MTAQRPDGLQDGSDTGTLARLLEASWRFDASGYATRARIRPADAARHYVTEGWRIGLEPLLGIDSAWFGPFFGASGLTGPAATTWLELEACGAYPPATREDAERLATEVRQSPLFDAAGYRSYLLADVDPALHYSIVGEAMGLRPSRGFDPAYYRERYPDCAAWLAGSRLLVHFERHGLAEGRRPRAFPDEARLPDDNHGQPVVLVALGCAELEAAASELIEAFAGSDHVVLIEMGETGACIGRRLAEGDAFSVPAEAQSEPADMRRLAVALVDRYRPLAFIGVGLAIHTLLRAFPPLGIPAVAVIASPAIDGRAMSLIDRASAVVFATAAIEQTILATWPEMRAHTSLHVIPPMAEGQGDTGWAQRIIALARSIDGRNWRRDVETLLSNAAIDPALQFPPFSEDPGPVAREFLAVAAWASWNGMHRPAHNPRVARPCAGFNPQVYAAAHREACVVAGRHPLAHWIDAGRPAGPWARPVYRAGERADQPFRPRVCVHAHFHYPELAGAFFARLGENRTAPDIVLTTDTTQKRDSLLGAARANGRTARVEIVPNRGRNFGPLFTGLRDMLLSDSYDVLLHVHGKRTLQAAGDMGERWRSFLWTSLIGAPGVPMLDVAAAAFAENASLGLLFAEDPHLMAWNLNRPMAETLARRMGIDALPDFFDFPVGGMFAARPAALAPLLKLGLGWDDYPEEPAPGDGTILHAIERLIPFAVAAAGFTTGALRAGGTSR